MSLIVCDYRRIFINTFKEMKNDFCVLLLLSIYEYF